MSNKGIQSPKGAKEKGKEGKENKAGMEGKEREDREREDKERKGKEMDDKKREDKEKEEKKAKDAAAKEEETKERKSESDQSEKEEALKEGKKPKESPNIDLGKQKLTSLSNKVPKPSGLEIPVNIAGKPTKLKEKKGGVAWEVPPSKDSDFEIPKYIEGKPTKLKEKKGGVAWEMPASKASDWEIPKYIEGKSTKFKEKKGGVAWEVPIDKNGDWKIPTKIEGEDINIDYKHRGGIAWDIPLAKKTGKKSKKFLFPKDKPIEFEAEGEEGGPVLDMDDKTSSTPRTPTPKTQTTTPTQTPRQTSPKIQRADMSPKPKKATNIGKTISFISERSPYYEPSPHPADVFTRRAGAPELGVGGLGDWFNLFRGPVAEQIADPRRNVKLTINSDRKLTSENFVNVCQSLKIDIEALRESQKEKVSTSVLASDKKMFEGMELEMMDGGKEAHVVKYQPGSQECVDIFHINHKDNKTVEIVAADFLPEDDALFTMVLAAKNAAEQESKSKSFKIKNCEDNPAAAFKLYLIGKCFGLQPRFFDKPDRRDATENSLMNTSFGDITLKTKDGEEKTIREIMSDVRRMTTKEAGASDTLNEVKQYISQLKVMEEEETFKSRPGF